MKFTDYKSLCLEASALFENENYKITILSNASALLNTHIDDINWVGFYLYKDNQLILGPFQGNVACTQIPLTKGVCGACATSLKPIVVKNVHEFSGHIACDSRSNSEIVLPIILNDALYGVLDIDSPSLNRFTDDDLEGLTNFIKILQNTLVFSN